MVEPMAVAVHAVAKAPQTDSVYMVVGCGPIGLSIIAELKSRGMPTQRPSDHSDSAVCCDHTHLKAPTNRPADMESQMIPKIQDVLGWTLSL
jgi:hypothetical protein